MRLIMAALLMRATLVCMFVSLVLIFTPERLLFLQCMCCINFVARYCMLCSFHMSIDTLGWMGLHPGQTFISRLLWLRVEKFEIRYCIDGCLCLQFVYSFGTVRMMSSVFSLRYTDASIIPSP